MLLIVCSILSEMSQGSKFREGLDKSTKRLKNFKGLYWHGQRRNINEKWIYHKLKFQSSFFNYFVVWSFLEILFQIKDFKPDLFGPWSM